jgi:hypothetical protein
MSRLEIEFPKRRQIVDRMGKRVEELSLEQQKAIVRFVKVTAQSLNRLELQGWVWCCRALLETMHHLADEIYFLNLSSLGLEDMAVHDYDLVKFIGKHQSTLSDLRLSDMATDQVWWRILLNNMAEMPMHQLRTMGIRNPSKGEFMTWMNGHVTAVNQYDVVSGTRMARQIRKNRFNKSTQLLKTHLSGFR